MIESTPLLKVSEMAESLAGSEIIKLAGEIREKIDLGAAIHNFTIGDFDPGQFPIPVELRDAIMEAYQHDHTNYPAASGELVLREAISRFLHTRGTLEYNSDQLLVASGSRPLIYAAYQTLLDADDTVVFPVPSWNNNHYTHLAHGRQVPVECKAANNFMPTAEDLKPFISEAKLIALCSPLNPAGTTFTRKGLEEICQLVLDENRKRGENKKPVYLLFDQVYWLLTHGDTIHIDPVSLMPEMKNYTIFIDGLSKAFAATGVRVGWAAGPHKVIRKMKAILGHIGAWAPKPEQMAVAKYLGMDDAVDDYLFRFKSAIEERLNALHSGFLALRAEGYRVNAIAPQASIYLTVQMELNGQHTPEGERLSNTAMITQYLLTEAGVALVPFNAFGASKKSNWYRLSVGTASMEDIENFFAKLRVALDKLS